MRTVLFFGFYDRGYARTHVLQNGFKRNGWHVEECHVDPRTNRGLSKYLKLFLLGHSYRAKKHDLVLVGFPGHNAVWLARMLFGKRIVFDAFLSLYETNVDDRRLYGAHSWKAYKDYMLDMWSCRLAGTVLLDTAHNIDYFVKTFNLPRPKFIRVFISADDTIFYPAEAPDQGQFTVHFHGTFIPLQGITYIVEAAHELRESGIRFRIIGGGQDAVKVDERIRALGLTDMVERIPKVPVADIPGYIAQAHVVLGIFGNSDRGLRAIPNKVYEAMAMGKAIITVDSVGIHELPEPEKLFSLVPPADPRAIANSIVALRDNESRRKALGLAARIYFEEHLMPEKLIAELLAALKVR